MDELAAHHGVALALGKQWPASPFMGLRLRAPRLGLRQAQDEAL